MKKIFRNISLFLVVLCISLVCFTACNNSGNGEQVDKTPFVDYVSQLSLDMESETAKTEVTVKDYIDGDTTHFNVDKSIVETGILKGRYLAINTPESTGLVEEYGVEAKNFTNGKLRSAQSIIVESDTSEWNKDSTGSRILVWVWYKPAGGEYRNLNLEILQNGLAIGSSSANNRYGEICMKALEQAKRKKMKVHSGEKDPNYYYGSAIELTLKEVRLNCEAYSGKKVAFNGIITRNNNNGVYVEAFDVESNLYFGIYCYYGFNMDGFSLEVLQVGNEVRIVGTLQYYETGKTWQVSGLQKVDLYDPTNAETLQLISKGHQPAYVNTDPAKFANSEVSVEVADPENKGSVLTKSLKYAEAVMNTSIMMENLKVEKVHTTNNGGNSDGAMTLSCVAPDGTKISVRTVVLYDEEGNMITQEKYQGKTISVKGFVDFFMDKYQIKVLTDKDITILN